VKSTLESFLGTVEIEEREKPSTRVLIAKFDEREILRIVRQMIYDRRIIDAVRTRLRSNWNGSNSSFVRFDKQTATLRKLRLIDDRDERPPLGSMQLDCYFDNEAEFADFIDWFVPHTEDGRIVRIR
jgi:predicted RNA binding protein with dsRBD fold (UPF0201 family)